MPAELDELRRKVMQMEIEEAALKKEDDTLSKERLEALQKELAELKSEYNNRKAQWDNEKKSVENLSKLREEIEAVNNEIQIAQREGDLEKAAELSYGKLPDLKKQLDGKLPENVKLLAFLKRMDLAYAAADIVVARAGAGTISELCLLEKAAVLIPSPNVAEDHQTKNAMALVDKGAAVMIRDTEAEERLEQVLTGLLSDEKQRKELEKHIAKLAIRDSDEQIAREILKVIG